MGNNLYTVSEEEKYFFDLRGSGRCGCSVCG